MCGIAGFVGRFTQSDLVGMAQALRHRGPDDEGIVLLEEGSRNTIGLAHRRLSIIDLSPGGHQPMISVDGRLHIVFNGEIYNYQELRRDLIGAHYCFRTNSDTEVILAAYDRWGEACVNKLSGMFAFAIFDKARGHIFAARDRFGIKPFYWMLTNRGFAFASEIGGLLVVTDKVEMRREAFYNMLLFGWNGSPNTIFDGIQQLPPAHCMTVDLKGRCSSPRRYWQLPEEEARLSVAEATERLRDEFDAAVKAHLVADVPVGINLSGGLDSSGVLASMSRYVPAERIEAFTIGFGLADDETPFARTAAAYVGTNLKAETYEPGKLASLFAECIKRVEEPIAHPVMATTYLAAKAVRARMKISLVGEGSDELFAGYPQYRAFSQFLLMQPPWRQKLFLAVAHLMPPPHRLLQLLAPEMRDPELIMTLAHQYDHYFETGDQQRGALRFELEQALPNNQLLRVDKLTMAHSVEARVPFLDHQFAAFAFTLPFDMKVRNGQHKWILRKAFADRLPQNILYRSKSGKGGTQALLPRFIEMVRHGALAHLIAPETIRSRGWFDAEAVGRYLRGTESLSVRLNPIESRRRAKFALALATIEQWARIYLDNKGMTAE